MLPTVKVDGIFAIFKKASKVTVFWVFFFCFLFCFVLFWFVLFCFALFCFVLFCFVLFCFVFVLFLFLFFRFVFCFVFSFFVCFVLFCFVLFCFFKLLNLRGYCTSGPYFWRFCAFSQKIKQLRTKYPMDLVRNVPRNSKITILLQCRPLLWRDSEKCAKINIFHVLSHKSITTWVSETPVQ